MGYISIVLNQNTKHTKIRTPYASTFRRFDHLPGQKPCSTSTSTRSQQPFRCGLQNERLLYIAHKAHKSYLLSLTPFRIPPFAGTRSSPLRLQPKKYCNARTASTAGTRILPRKTKKKNTYALRSEMDVIGIGVCRCAQCMCFIAKIAVPHDISGFSGSSNTTFTKNASGTLKNSCTFVEYTWATSMAMVMWCGCIVHRTGACTG